MTNETTPKRTLVLALGALGIVYGDIGTSPLYAIRECFHGLGGEHALDPTRGNVLGVLSAVIWSLLVVVCLKYLAIILRMSNRGEGGIIALLALTLSRLPGEKARTPLMVLGACGAALLFGEGMITPAISVMSAVEGLGIATPRMERFVIPITLVIIVALFSLQRVGTGRIGEWFGPVMLVWFAVLALLGIRGILEAPEILAAVNPWHALRFFWEQGWEVLFVLGAVFLVVTGAEALYADMGHFGAGPIRVAWFAMVFPALLLNYAGQSAWLLKRPDAVVNPFFSLAPEWALLPLVLLATIAAIVASQALISGAFSIARQAIQLGLLPRLKVRHTSSTERGQIYVSAVNWVLMVACLGLVLGFRSSSDLAAAYGVGVSLTIILTTALFYFAARHVWDWSSVKAGLAAAGFLVVEVVFFVANSMKFDDGGWFPILAGVLIYICMGTWFRGRTTVQKRLMAASMPLGMFLAEMERKPPTRVPGTAVFMSGNPSGTPGALLHNLKHNKVLHERVILLRFAVAEAPHVPPPERVQIEKLPLNCFRVTAFFGFMETPELGAVIEACAEEGLELDPMKTTFFLGRETVLPTRRPGMAFWRKRLFALMSRNAEQAMVYYELPPNRVVELGMQVEL